MPAPIKYKTKSDSERSAIVDNLLKEVLDTLKSQDGNVKLSKLEIFSVGHGFRPFGNAFPNDYIDITISINGKKFDGLGRNDVAAIGNSLVKKLNNQKSVKGWETISVTEKDVFLGYGSFTPDFTFPNEVKVMGKPCKEFDKLNNLLTKHYGHGISQSDLYHVNLFGKRASYDESGGRIYLCFYPEVCNRFIDKAKKAYKGGKKKSFSVVVSDDIDTTHSARYETECYGERHTDLMFV